MGVENRPLRIALLFQAGNHYFDRVLRGIAGRGREHGGWDLLVWDRSRVDRAELAAGRLDAAVLDFTQTASRRHFAWLAKTGIPVVDVTPDRHDLSDRQRCAVRPDHRQVGVVAARHLLECGLRQLAYCGYPKAFSRLRHASFTDEAARVGVTVRAYDDRSSGWTDTAQSYDNSALPAFLSSLPRGTGLFCANDNRALQCIQLLRQLGRAIPEDVAIVGVDNHAVAEIITPAVTTVPLNPQTIGHFAGQRVLDLLAGSAPPRETLVPPLPVFQRASSDVLASTDEHVTRAVRFIRSRYHEPICIRDIVADATISYRSLQDRCRRQLRRSLQDELMRCRIEHAKLLLQNHNLRISDVGRRCGLGSAIRFSTAFRRETGLTPSQFRQQLRPDKFAQPPT